MKQGNLSSHSLKGNWAKNLYFIDIDVTADGTGAISATALFKLEIIDVIVQARATSASGTATVRTGTTAISDAIAMATDKAVVHAGTIDDAHSEIAKDGNINVITNGAADRGKITLVVQRLGD